MKLLLALSYWCLWGAGALAGGGGPTESEVRFQIVNAGLAVEGSFSGVEATIRFDPAHPELAHIRATAPVRTVQTGISLRDQHLQKPDYFDAEKYPAIVLVSKTIRKTGPDRYEGVFTLTIKGITREVSLPFTVSATHEFRGQLRLNRLDFDLGKPSLVLSNEVAVGIRLVEGRG